MRPINMLVVHSSATPADMDVDIEFIRKVHVEENGWSDVGYHYIIPRQGPIQVGRPLHKRGAHIVVEGHNYNQTSVGVCLIGGKAKNSSEAEANFTDHQLDLLRRHLTDLRFVFPGAAIGGHRDWDSKTQCPGFDVRDWFFGGWV